jgi:oxalate decarboxylase/phosphoglucose isomerase-like protein (cupin superfamily)
VAQRYKYNLTADYLRLKPDASVEPLALGDHFWPQLMSGKLGDFHHEYLVTMGSHERDWTSWECHPGGDEIVLLLTGRAVMVLETAQGEERVELAAPGDYVRIPRDTWHTAKMAEPTSMLFITAGEGTKHRPVDPAS